MSVWEEKDQPVLDNLEEWATRLSERVLEKECEHIPPAVVVKALLKSLSRWVPKCEIITPDTAVKILANEFGLNDIDDDRGIFTPAPTASNN